MLLNELHVVTLRNQENVYIFLSTDLEAAICDCGLDSPNRDQFFNSFLDTES